MSQAGQSEAPEAQRRRLAVQMFRAGHRPDEIAQQLERSRRWIYHWIAYQRQHPHTRFRSASRAPHHHPNQTPRSVERRVLQVRRTLQHQRNPRLRYAPIGPRTIRRELIKRRVKPVPSLSTIQRIVKRGGLTNSNTANPADPYRPHPPAESPNAVQATDIITRWIEGGETVQTFTTVDLVSNAASATSLAHKSADAARQHLLQTWRTLGVPNLAQFDNESVFNGGRHPHVLGRTVRLCLYLGIEVLFTPEDEADYNWEVEAFNNLWAHQFWAKHHFTHRYRIPPAQRAFLRWHYMDYVAPRQTNTPARLRHGHSIYHLSKPLATQIPTSLPICAGLVHAIRCVSDEGRVTFLNESFRVGKRHAGQYVWLTLSITQQRLTVYHQAQAEDDWQTLKVFPYPLDEPIQPVPKQFACLHAEPSLCRMC
jgi:hypothetical protein